MTAAYGLHVISKIREFPAQHVPQCGVVFEEE